MKMVWGQKRGVDDLVAKVRENKPGDRTMLILSLRKFDDEEAAKLCQALEENDQLEELLCSGHRITAAGASSFAKALKKNRNLKKLSLGCNAFGDEATQALFQDWENDSLEHLDLEFKSLSGNSMGTIASALNQPLNGLQELLLGRNQIGDSGLARLAEGLVSNQHLKLLDLRTNGISSEGCRALGVAFKNVRNQNRDFMLKLDGNKIGSDGLSALAVVAVDDDDDDDNKKIGSGSDGTRGPMKITYLSVRDCDISGSEGLDQFASAMGRPGSSVSSLEILDLGENKVIMTTQSCSDMFGRNETIKELILEKNGLETDQIVMLSEAFKESGSTSSLRMLDLSSNNLETHDKLFENLMHPRALETLKLLGNKKLGDEGARLLAKSRPAEHCALKHLSLSGTGITAEGCKDLLTLLHENLQQLRTLELGGNDIGEEGRLLVEKSRETHPHFDIAIDKNPNEHDDPAAQEFFKQVQAKAAGHQ